jgi:hypothetical protein
MMRCTPLLALLLVSGCTPSGGGPSPRAVLVVSSRDYSIDRVLEPLDSIRGVLGSRVDKSKQTIEVGDRKLPQFPMYQVAYWYPDNGSDYYGVAVVKWVTDGEDTNDRYFIDVYAEDESCSLCGVVKAALDEHHVSYFSACDNPTKSTRHEKMRCGT